MDILKLQHEAWRIAEKAGWHQGRELEFGEFIALCHSELSEALEIFRKVGNMGIPKIKHVKSEIVNAYRPEGIPIELADVIIRIFDYCEINGIRIHEAINVKNIFNEKRPHRHGNKII